MDPQMDIFLLKIFNVSSPLIILMIVMMMMMMMMMIYTFYFGPFIPIGPYVLCSSCCLL